MKQLSLNDIYLIPSGFKSLAVDGAGVLSAFRCRKCHLIPADKRWVIDSKFQSNLGYPSIVLGYGYDTANWRNSAINKE